MPGPPPRRPIRWSPPLPPSVTVELCPTHNKYLYMTGSIRSVAGTWYDLREETTWGEAVSRVVSPQNLEGLVVCYQVRGPTGMRYAAR